MIDFPLRFYLSSSWKGDLEAEKEIAEEIVKELFMQPVFSSVASPEDITSDYFKRLINCDIIIVILGSLYSKHVENEFKCALINEIPVLVFKKECEREEQLQNKIESTYNLVTLKPFRTETELREVIKTSIVDLLATTFRAQRNIEKAIKPLVGNEIRLYYPKPTESEYKDVPRINPFERK
jgi:hypothetical protein